MGGDDFEPDDPCDVIELEALKAKVCFVSEDVDKDNAKMGKKEEAKPVTRDARDAGPWTLRERETDRTRWPG